VCLPAQNQPPPQCEDVAGGY